AAPESRNLTVVDYRAIADLRPKCKKPGVPCGHPPRLRLLQVKLSMTTAGRVPLPGSFRLDISLSDEHRAIDENVSRICARFTDAYWTECDQTPRFPEEFHQAMAEAGWLGI